jgi:formylglycine-generating enzyme required for sulfatase activity
MVMVYVPAGEFVMGSADSDVEAENDERPQHKVILDAFWIDRTEVTKELYQRCVAVKKCTGVGGSYSLVEKDQPVVGVDWFAAANYCAWVGRRLPTEAEWEKAARGTDGRKYPWGDDPPDCRKLNYGLCGISNPVSVGSYAGSSRPSPYGTLDMAGNVWEWTSSLWGTNFLRPDFGYPYRLTDGRESSDAPNTTWRVVRGGSYDDQEKFVRVTLRFRLEPDSSNLTVGFRCACSP